jgi:putative transposase
MHWTLPLCLLGGSDTPADPSGRQCPECPGVSPIHIDHHSISDPYPNQVRGKVALARVRRATSLLNSRSHRTELATVGIVNMELRENIELACALSILPSGAQRTSHIDRCRVGGLQISSHHLEKLALRHQLGVLRRSVKRPELTSADRLLWTWLCEVWSDWRSALIIVKPETVVAWHRKGFRLFWTWKVRRGQPGRPAVPKDVRELIRRMSRENPLWGAPRIHGESLKLGIDIGETSVGKYLAHGRKPPSQTWRTSLENHVKAMVSVYFFTVPTIRFQVLYVFLVLAHDRRRVVHFNVTAHPTAEWTVQQLREAFPFEQIPRYLLRTAIIFGAEFRKDVNAMGTREVLSAPGSPWQRAYVERLIGTLRRECLDHVIVFNEASLYRHVKAFLAYYHESRTHLALAKDTPESRPLHAPERGAVIAIPQVGGLHHRYERRAA